MAAPAGSHIGLNLGVAFAGAGSHVPLNLGDWVGEIPDPPEPVIRGLRASASMPWSKAARAGRAIGNGWSSALRTDRATRMPWRKPSPLQRSLELLWGLPPQQRSSAAIPWGTPAQRRTARTMPWSSLPITRQATSMPWIGRLAVAQLGASFAWRHPGLARVGRSMHWHTQPPTRHRGAVLRWGSSPQLKRIWRLPWGNAPLVPWIVRPGGEDPNPPDPPSPFPPGNAVGLNLGCPVIEGRGIVPLNLGVLACYAVRPKRRTYIVLNSVLVVRLPDRTPIEVDSISIGGGADAWGWTFDLNLCKPADLVLLKPSSGGPRQIEVTLNGYVWTAIIESYNTRREWNGGGVSVSGRSRTALLSSPYAPLRAKVSEDVRLMAQLVDEELVDTGFTASYDTVDWLVPAGAWYYDSTAPLDAISRLAEASGGVVQSHPEDESLTVRARYPISPWDWPVSTPDATVYDDIMTALSLQVRSQPLYDAVVVTGEISGKGVTVRVKRTGEAGTLYAPQISSTLINTTPAGRERGRNVLSDRGEQASIDFALPLFPAPVMPGQTGRVLPLDLVEVHEAGETWHGLCTNVRIEARVEGNSSGGSAWVVEQTLSLERHYSDAN